MTVICTPPTTPESRKRHAETFGEGLTRSRWLEEGRPDETYMEWVARMNHEALRRLISKAEAKKAGK